MTLIREDQADIRVWLNGVPQFDSWRTAEGGNLEADTSKTRPGAMGKEVDAGGPASRDDLTVTTQFTDAVAAAHPGIENQIGIARGLVGINWLNPDRTLTGYGTSRQGTLKAAFPPEHGDGSDVGMYTMVFGMDEAAA